MCIGIPLQVLHVEPGHAVCTGRAGTRRVLTALVGDVQPGDWLLVFLDSAQERLTPERAAEIDATLAMVEAAAAGDAVTADAAFDLPSRWSADELRALTQPEGR